MINISSPFKKRCLRVYGDSSSNHFFYSLFTYFFCVDKYGHLFFLFLLWISYLILIFFLFFIFCCANMENLISVKEGLIVLLVFWVFMISLVYFLTRKKVTTNETFLVADRKVSRLRWAFSIAVSWVWAPAIFIASLQAYTQWLAWAFRFVVPNILCFFLFAPLAVRLRRLMPEGYTLPQYILMRFGGDKKTHIAFLVIFFLYQLWAIIINAVAGGTLLHILTGIDFQIAVLWISVVALIYSLISGLEASMLTDVIQMLIILLFWFVLVPWVVFNAWGIESIVAGLWWITGEFWNALHPGVFRSFGIATTIGLLSWPIGDQMFFQRGFAVQYKNIVKTFVVWWLLFWLVPIMLSLLWFIAANPAFSSLINVTDPQMVAPLTIGYFLPKFALIMFVFMAFAWLSSTIDSAYCVISSLGTIDIYKKYFKDEKDEKKILSVSRKFMIGCAIVWTGIALFQPKLLRIFLIYGTLGGAWFFPTILSLYRSRLTSKWAFWAVVLWLLFWLPLSIYANITWNIDMIVWAAIWSVSIGLVVCLVFWLLNTKTRFDFKACNYHK